MVTPSGAGPEGPRRPTTRPIGPTSRRLARLLWMLIGLEALVAAGIGIVGVVLGVARLLPRDGVLLPSGELWVARALVVASAAALVALGMCVVPLRSLVRQALTGELVLPAALRAVRRARTLRLVAVVALVVLVSFAVTVGVAYGAFDVVVPYLACGAGPLVVAAVATQVAAVPRLLTER